MLSFSKGLIISMLGIGGLGNVMNGGVIRIFSGLRPVTANAAIPPTTDATMLGKITLDGKTFYAGADPEGAGLQLTITDSGVIKNYGSWVLTATKSGIPAWFRWTWSKFDADDDSFYYPRIDGFVTPVDIAGDDYDDAITNYGIVLPTKTLIAGQTFAINRVMLWFKETGE